MLLANQKTLLSNTISKGMQLLKKPITKEIANAWIIESKRIIKEVFKKTSALSEYEVYIEYYSRQIPLIQVQKTIKKFLEISEKYSKLI